MFPIMSTETVQPSVLHSATSQSLTILSSWLSASRHMPVEGVGSAPHDAHVDCRVSLSLLELIVSDAYLSNDIAIS